MTMLAKIPIAGPSILVKLLNLTDLWQLRRLLFVDVELQPRPHRSLMRPRSPSTLGHIVIREDFMTHLDVTLSSAKRFAWTQARVCLHPAQPLVSQHSAPSPE